MAPLVITLIHNTTKPTHNALSACAGTSENCLDPAKTQKLTIAESGRIANVLGLE